MSRPLPTTTILLHWAVGLGVIGLMCFGFWLGSLPKGYPKTDLVQIHKSFGMIVFALALARIAWRLKVGFPQSGAANGFEGRLSHAVHHALLAATILMPVSGVVRSLAYARPVSVFGVPVIPQLLAEKNEALNQAAGAFHDCLGLALLGLLALHVLGAAKHHLLDGDETLSRMVGASASSRKTQS